MLNRLYTIGAYNPFHIGHAHLFHAGLTHAKEIHVAVGSKNKASRLPLAVRREAVEVAIHSMGWRENSSNRRSISKQKAFFAKSENGFFYFI